MSTRPKNIEQAIVEGTKALLARAMDSRQLDLADVLKRIELVVEKYLLRDDNSASANDVRSFVDGLQADDLCLVIACERSDANAWDELVSRFSVVVRSAARSATANEDAAEDLAQSIWAELHGLRASEQGTPAGKLSYYSGRGSLAGWLRAVVAQLAIDQHRKQSRLVQTEEDAELDRIANEERQSSSIPADLMTPAANAEQKFAAREIKHALTKAIGELDPEERLLVKLYYFDELRLREAGAVLGVHEATASRRLTKIHQSLRSAVRRILVEEHRWTTNEADRCFAEVAMHLDMNLEQLVASTGASDDERHAG